MEQIKWGIIGCGNVTEQKSGPAFSKVEGSSLHAVMRRDAAKAADFAHRHGIPKWYSNAEELINDKDVNAVYVATPPDTHALYSIKAMQAGKPVYVEKPMARNYEECMKMIEVSSKLNIPLFVAYYRRSLPGFVKVKGLLESGAIGTPYTVNIQLFKSASANEKSGDFPWRVIPEIAGGGHFVDLASHQLDYLDFLFGPIKRVNGIARNKGGYYKAEDTVQAVFEFETGLIGTGSWCFVAPAGCACDKIEIIGSKGRIAMSCYAFTPLELEIEGEKQMLPFERPEHVQLHLIQEVVNEILGRGKSPSSGITAARTSNVMDTILRDYYKTNKINQQI